MEYIIYKIVCNNLDVKHCYVGLTNDFTRRKGEHKRTCEKNKPIKIYEVINENGGWTNWSMLKIESVIDSKVDAQKKERYWYEKLNADLNMVCPNRDRKEYLESNKETIKETSKKYRVKNKEKWRAYYKELYLNHKDTLKAKRKEYWEANREVINIKKKMNTRKQKIKKHQHSTMMISHQQQIF